MPKKRTSSSKKLRKGAAAASPGSNGHKKTAKEYVEAAELAMQSQDAHQAIALYNAALDVSSVATQADVDTTFVLEKRAEAKVSISDVDGAREDYQQALKLVRRRQPAAAGSTTADAPSLERMASLLLYMGQLSGGKDALDAYQEGIAMLRSSLELRQKETTVATNHPTATAALDETRKQLAAACCSAAEVFLTDLCDQENAEQECESYVKQALSSYVDPQTGAPLIDALQTSASLLFSQCRGLEAVESIRQCYSQLQAPCEALSKLVGMYLGEDASNDNEMKDNQQSEQAMELTQIQAVQALPGFEFRCQTAKLLLEGCACLVQADQDEPGNTQNYKSQSLQCAQAAVHVLGSLMAENDEVIEIWFLAGDAYNCLEQNGVAQQYYEQTLEMLQQVKQSLEQELDEACNQEEEEDLQQQVDEITCQLEDVQQKLEEMGDTKNSAEPMEE